MQLEYTCSFFLLLRDEPYEVLDRTIKSILAFRHYAYNNEQDSAQILCICGDGQSATLPRLRVDANKHGLEVYARSDWWPDEQKPFTMPEVCGLFMIGAKRAYNQVIFLIEPGEEINQTLFQNLGQAIRSTGVDYKLFVASHNKKDTHLPVSAVFSKNASQFGPLRTAVDGYGISMKKKFLRGLELERENPPQHDKAYNLPWLIGAIAFEFEEKNSARHLTAGLHLTYSKWT